MKITVFVGASLLAPLTALAHDGDHVVAAWYQDPYTIGLLVAALATLSLLGYGFLAKKKSFTTIPAIVLVVIAIIGLTGLGQNSTLYEPQLVVTDFGAGETVTLYKSPNCGCCSGHAKALEEAGFAVNIVETNELDQIKSERNIPPTGASCHTSIINDYVVEGHVPLEAIETVSYTHLTLPTTPYV